MQAIVKVTDRIVKVTNAERPTMWVVFERFGPDDLYGGCTLSHAGAETMKEQACKLARQAIANQR
jgi:phenylpyruvate tautomerase PptA (4-oxalocrotonate tautomerase family)